MSENLELHTPRLASQVEAGLIWSLTSIVFLGFLTLVIRTVRCRWPSATGLVRRMLKRLPNTEPHEELKAAVQQRLVELKVSRMRLYLLAICCVAFPWSLGVLLQVIQGSFPLHSTPLAEIISLVFQTLYILVLVKPGSLTARTLDVAFLAVVVNISLLETPLVCCTQEYSANTQSWINLIAILILNLVRGLGSWRDLRLLALGNTVYVGCALYTRWRIYWRVDTWAGLAGKGGSWALIVALTMVLSAAAEAGYRQLMTQGLQLAEVREMHKAATALLRSCYDVVVELDHSGSLDSACLDLGSLLLRADHNRSMHGVHLADLIMDEEDRESFQRKLAAPRRTIGLAETMHVRMKDGLGNTLRMELMWFACTKVSPSSNRFIVGIREFSDQMEAQPGKSHSQGAPNVFPAPSESSESSSSEGTMPLSQPESMDIEADQAVVVIDLSHESCPIRSLSTGFRANVGHVPKNAPLSQIVRKTGPMVTWLQGDVNSVMNGNPPSEGFNVSLRTSQGKSKARCRLLVAEDDAGRPDVDLWNIAVLFFNITHKRSRHSGSKRRLSGTPARPSSEPLRFASL